MPLIETIEQIQNNLKRERYRNESSVREAIVVPILADLGWPVIDPDIVAREYSIETRRVDYALFSKGDLPDVLIEVKAVGHCEGADKQLFEYIFLYGVPFAILTDGREWTFYLPQERGIYQERRLYKLDLLERSNDEAADILQRYLSYDRINSGEAYEDARKDFQDAARKKQAAEAIPKAWEDLISEKDEILLRLISEQVQKMCGYAPADKQIWSFLKGLTSEKKPEPKGTVAPSRLSQSPVTEQPPVHRRRSSGRTLSTQFSIFGKELIARSATEAMIQILTVLSKRRNDFFERLAEQVKGKKRNHIARRPEDVYPLRPNLIHCVKPLVNGWFIGDNISNREKTEFVRKACGIAGVTFGKDIIFEVVNN